MDTPKKIGIASGLFLLALSVILSQSHLASAQLGYNNPNLPQIIKPPTITTSGGVSNVTNNYFNYTLINGSSFNVTYNLWAYNQTIPAIELSQNFTQNNYVPYIGAIDNIVLGNYNLTTLGNILFNGGSWTGGHIIYVPVNANINDYVRNATAGDVLILGAGIYNINSTINLNKAITLRGQGINSTYICWINTIYSSPLINVSANQVLIDNLQIICRLGGDCIKVQNKNEDLGLADFVIQNSYIYLLCLDNVDSVGVNVINSDFRLYNTKLGGYYFIFGNLCKGTAIRLETVNNTDVTHSIISSEIIIGSDHNTTAIESVNGVGLESSFTVAYSSLSAFDFVGGEFVGLGKSIYLHGSNLATGSALYSTLMGDIIQDDGGVMTLSSSQWQGTIYNNPTVSGETYVDGLLANSLWINFYIGLNGTLEVWGDGLFYNDLYVGDDLIVYGDALLESIAPTSGNLNVVGNLNVSENITAKNYHNELIAVYTLVGMTGNTECNYMDNAIAGITWTCQTCVDTGGTARTCGTTLITLNANCLCKED